MVEDREDNFEDFEIPEIDFPRRGEKGCRGMANIFADCETYLQADGYPVWEHRHEEGFSVLLANKCLVVPWLLGVLHPRVTFDGIDKREYVQFTSSQFPHPGFFEILRNIYQRGYIPVIWFHNATYDLTSCIETAFRCLDRDLVIYFTAKQDKGFLFGAMESVKWGFKAKFGDTLLYKRRSIREVGEIFKSPKGEIPYMMMDLQRRGKIIHYTDWYTGARMGIPLVECENYVINDVVLLKRYFEKLKEEKSMITRKVAGYDEKGIRANTQGIHARELLDLWLFKQRGERYQNVFRFEVDDAEGLLMQRSLTGGYTTINTEVLNYICDDAHRITSFDVNSMYPYIMTLGLPYKTLLDTPPAGDFVEWVCISAVNVRWSGKLSSLGTPPIPTNKQTHEKSKKATHIYIFRELLEFIKENSEGEITEHYVKYQEKTKIAGSFVNYLYNLRIEIRESRELAEREMENETLTPYERARAESRVKNLLDMEEGVKTTSNSLYGKMAEKSYLSKIVYLDGKFRTQVDEKAKYTCTLTGAYIALYGRFIIYQHIKKVLDYGFTFLYSDTDSIKLAYPIARENELEDIFGINIGKLGQWKNEGTWDEYHSPGKKKKYAFISKTRPHDSKITLSGISKDPYINALTNGLAERPESTLEDIRFIFSRENNVIFRAAKNSSIRNIKHDQTIICPIDVSSNASLGKLTGECYMVGGKYRLIRYGDK